VSIVRWIDECNVQRGIEKVQRFDEIHLEDLKILFHIQGLQILPDHLARLPGLLDKVDERSSPADRFDSDSADSGASVKECGTLNARTENIKDGFLELVACRPYSRGRRTFEMAAPELAGNNSHR